MSGGERECDARSGDPPLRRRLLRLAGVTLHDVTKHVVDPGHKLARDLDARRLDVLRHLLGPGGTDERGGDVVVLQDPCDGQLGHRQPELVGDRLEVLHPSEHLITHEPLDHVGAPLLVGGA